MKNYLPALVVLLQALLHVLRKVRPLVGCIEGAGEQDNCHLEWDENMDIVRRTSPHEKHQCPAKLGTFHRGSH